METTGKIVLTAYKYNSQLKKGIITYTEFESLIDNLLKDLFSLNEEIRFTHKSLCDMKEKGKQYI